MSYEVLKISGVYENNKLVLLAVLWVSNSEFKWVRASYCVNRYTPGYGYLKPNGIISPELIQEVAGYGMNLPDKMKAKFFPRTKNFER